MFFHSSGFSGSKQVRGDAMSGSRRSICKAALLLSFVLLVAGAYAQSKYVYYGANGKLKYKSCPPFTVTNARGDMVPDFSSCGYASNDSAIPAVPVVKTITPVDSDNLSSIQAAIDEVSLLPMNSHGIRGAVLLGPGRYPVSNTIYIRASGVVLRGAGMGDSGTRIIATLRKKHDLIRVLGNSAPMEDSSSRFPLGGAYIPCGASTVTLGPAAHLFHEGDFVVIRREPNNAWIRLIGMDLLHTVGCDDWYEGDFAVDYLRIITDINVDRITLNAPMVDIIDTAYSKGYISRCTWDGRIEKVGVEDLRLISEFTDTNDEDHGWNGVSLDNVMDAWVRNVECDFFGYSAVTTYENAYRVSVINCRAIDPVSPTSGGFKYNFNCNGQLDLFRYCYGRRGRHEFVTGARVPGPNVFVDCSAESSYTDIGPHHRWATGILFDNIHAADEEEISVQNRLNSCNHGWAGAQCVFWNCIADELIVQSPPNHLNWAIGCIGEVTGKGEFKYSSDAYCVESVNNPVTPKSLFDAQVAERLLPTPVSGTSANTSAARMALSVVRAATGVAIRIFYDNPKPVRLTLFDCRGKTVAQKVVGAEGNTKERVVLFSNLSGGVYFAELRGGEAVIKRSFCLIR